MTLYEWPWLSTCFVAENGVAASNSHFTLRMLYIYFPSNAGRVSMEIDNTNTLGNSAKYCGRKCKF